MANVVPKFDFFLKLSSLKVSSALAGLLAFRSRKFSVCWYLGSNSAMVQSSRTSELCRIPSGRI